MNRLYLALLAPIMVLSCSTEPDEGPIQFIVKVDSINHPEVVSVGDTITIQMFGTIGSDGCHSFSRFEDSTQPLLLDLTVWGQRTTASVCPTVMVYLNGKEYSIVATQKGLYVMNIHQPDGSILSDSLSIN